MKNIFQIKITLKHIRPPVWRRIQVKAETRLSELHDILQTVMGWTDSHLHVFRIGHESYGVPDPDYPGDFINERNVRLDAIAEGETIIYEYDFGDGWEHELKIEKIMPVEKDISYPRCLAGKRACPPEDCGGPHGYMNMLKIIENPKDEEHENIMEWLGGDFDPEYFSVDEANVVLQG